MNINVNNNGTVETVSVSQVRSLQVQSEHTTHLTFFNGRKNIKGEVNLPLETIVLQIQKAVNISGSYGKVMFSDRYKDFSYNHRISILRENDATAHKRLCPICGRIDQIYQTGCQCKVSIPYNGKKTITNDTFKLSKQVIRLEEKDDDPETVTSLFNKFGQCVKEMVVSDIHFNKELGNVCGKIKLKNLEYTVYTDLFENIESVATDRHEWWRI